MAWDPVRKWIHRRPLMLFAACLTSGMAAGYHAAVPWRGWAIFFLVCAALGLLRRRTVFVFASALPLGALLIALALIRPAVSPQEDTLLAGRVSSEPTVREDYTRVILESASADSAALPCRVMLYLYGEDLPSLEYGAQISVPADLYLPTDRQNPYPSAYTDYLWRMDIALCASASADDLSVLSPPEFSLAGLSIQCRLRLQSVIEEIYSENVAPLISALLLGDRSMLPDELYSCFKTAGLAHLLAISGLHISCLAFMLDYLLRKTRCPERLTLCLVTLFLVIYAAVVGFPASICRAVLMYVLTVGARLFGRPSDGLTGLSMALIVLLLINPLSIGDVSLILSFSSVAVLMIFTRLFTPKRIYRIRGPLHKPVIWLISALAASLSTQLGALPAVACVFGSLPVYSLLANLPALPLMTLSLPFALLSLLLGLFSPAFGRFPALLVEWPLRALVFLTGRISALPGALADTPVWPAALIFAYAAVCVLCSQVSNICRRFKRLIACLLPILAVSALLLPMTLPEEGLEVLFLDAGQADAAVVRAEDVYYLIDVGEDETAADYLSASGIRPAGAFISHPHKDHAGGLAGIIERFPPSVLYLPCLWEDAPADEGVPELIAAARDAGWVIRFLQAGDTLRLSEHVSANVHQPSPGMTADGNGSSLVMSVSFGQATALFTGDLPAGDEHSLFPDCDLLKVAHHGAKGSTSSLFLRMTSPSVAVISVGHNSYGHPAEETLARLTDAGASVYRTDLCGAISVLLNADGSATVTPMQMQSQSEAAS